MDSLTATQVARAIEQGGSGNSEVVAELETALAEHVGGQYALCTPNGTSALICGLWAAGVRPGDSVAVSVLGPSMTGLAILALGATPHFVDSADPRSFGLDLDSVTAALDAGVAAVVTVPMWGYWDERPETLTTVRDRGVPLIVDAAQAPFLRLTSDLCTIADVVCLSLHGRKPLKAGEGGVCITNDERLATRIVNLRNFGQEAKAAGRRMKPHGAFGSSFGANFKMNALGAAWCLAQVHEVETVRHRLARLRERALAEFAAAGLHWTEAAQAADVAEHGRYGLVAIGADREVANRLSHALEAKGIEVDTTRYRYGPMYEVPALVRYRRPCRIAERLTERAVAIRLEALEAAGVDTPVAGSPPGVSR